jgi:circadian clock protein KaiB
MEKHHEFQWGGVLPVAVRWRIACGPAMAMNRILLRLFVTGSSQRSSRAIEAVQSLCRNHLGNAIEVEIIDVLEDPQKAEDDKILATPTLIRQSPGPRRRLVGDLSETDRIIELLGLRDQAPARIEE